MPLSPLRRLARTLLLCAVTLPIPPALAVSVAGVALPDHVEVAGQRLVLNGAGLRTKFFFKIYAAALYLPEKNRDAEAVIAAPGAKRVIMHFIYDEVEGEKLAAGWTEGFENNLDEAAFAALAPRLERFNALFTTVRKGDRIVLDFLADGRVTVTINGAQRGNVAGGDFQQALLRVWLGEEPADWDLRAALLGGED